MHETARVTDTPQRIRQIRVHLVEFDLRIGGTPPYPPPPDDRSELDYLNELITDTYWFCYAFMTHEQIDKLNEHESTMDPEVAVKVARDMYLVHVPRYLAQFLKKGKRVLIEGETGWDVEEVLQTFRSIHRTELYGRFFQTSSAASCQPESPYRHTSLPILWLHWTSSSD